jgi:mRNA interferase HigB
MRLIEPATVELWAKKHVAARPSLQHWKTIISSAQWTTFTDIRQTFSSADQVTVASDRTVIVFNIAGNRFRLITAVHYRTAIVFALRFLTHAEYSKDRWKNDL